jgi:YVTN family beta-propeller protein
MNKLIVARVPRALAVIGGVMLCAGVSWPARAQTIHTLAYVTNTASNVVHVVDLDTASVLTAISVGDTPVAIAASPDSGFVYVTNRGSNTVSVISADTNTVVATIGVGFAPEGLALSPNGATLYVANTFSNTVSVINTANRSVTNSIGVGNFPGHLAVAPSGNPLYVTNRTSQTLSVIDTGTLSVTATIPVGHYPWDIAVSPDGLTGYITNIASSKVTMFSTTSLSVVGTASVGTGPGAILAAPDASWDRVYVSNTEDGNITYLRFGGWWAQTQNVGTNSKPYGLNVTPLGNSLLVADYGTGTLFYYKVKWNGTRPTGSTTLGGSPYAVTSIRHQVS